MWFPQECQLFRGSPARLVSTPPKPSYLPAQQAVEICLMILADQAVGMGERKDRRACSRMGASHAANSDAPSLLHSWRELSANFWYSTGDMRFNERKRQSFEIFAVHGWIRPQEWALEAGFYPFRSSYSYLVRLHRWG